MHLKYHRGTSYGNQHLGASNVPDQILSPVLEQKFYLVLQHLQAKKVSNMLATNLCASKRDCILIIARQPPLLQGRRGFRKTKFWQVSWWGREFKTVVSHKYSFLTFQASESLFSGKILNGRKFLQEPTLPDSHCTGMRVFRMLSLKTLYMRR